MSIIISRFMGRSRSVQELVENWQFEHNQAMIVCDVDEIVSECIDLGTLLQHTWISIIEGLYNERVNDVDRTGQMFQMAVEKTNFAFDKAKVAIQSAQAFGYKIEKADSFKHVFDEVKEITRESTETWPKISPEMVAASRSDWQAGDYQTTEELLRESEGSDSQKD